MKLNLHDMTSELCRYYLFCKVKFPPISSQKISCITLTEDKQFLGTAYDNGELCIWDIITGIIYKYFNTNIRLINSILLNMIIRIFIFCGKDNKIYGWNIDTDKKEFQLSGHSNKILFLKLSNNGQYLASKSKDSTIKLWNLNKKEEFCSLELIDDELAEIPSMCFWKNDEYFVYPNMKLFFWNIMKNELEKVIDDEEIVVYSFAIGSDEKKMVYVDRGFIKLWDLDEWKDITEGDAKKIPFQSINDLEVNHDYTYAYINTCSFKGIFVWSISEGKEVSRVSEKTCQAQIPESFNQVVLTNEKIIYVAFGSLVSIYNLFDREILSLVGLPFESTVQLSRNTIYGVAISKLNERDVAFIYNLHKKKSVASFIININISKHFFLSNCGNYLGFNFYDKPTVVIDTRSPKKLFNLNPINSKIENEVVPIFKKLFANYAIVSNSQKHLLLYGPESFQIWRLIDLKLLFKRSKIKNTFFSPDMTYVITLDITGTLLYWSIPENKAVIKISENAYYTRYYPKNHLIVYYSILYYTFWDCKTKNEVNSINISYYTDIYDVSAKEQSFFILSNCKKSILHYSLKDSSCQTLNPFDSSEKQEITLLSTADDDTLLALATLNGLYIYNLIDSTQKIKISSRVPISLAFVSENRFFLMGFKDGWIALWDANKKAESWGKKVAESAVVALEISENNLYGAIRFKSSNYAVFNLKNGSFLDFHRIKRGKDFRFSADNKSFIVVNKKLVAKVYDINYANEIGKIDLLEKERRFFDEHPEFMEFREEFKELKLED